MDLVLFGMQGSGKGTQSKAIAEHCGLLVFETGAELRRLSTEDSELAHKVKSIIESGHLVPTEVVMEIIADFLHRLPTGKNALFDGIPRSGDQKEQFDALMVKEGRSFKGLLIELSEEEAVKRLTTRRMCPACKTIYPASYSQDNCEKDSSTLVTRQDDTPEAIRVRLDTFLEKTVPVINAYKTEGKMLTVKGEQAIEKVTLDIQEVLKTDFSWA
ncbi:nucleoside monophosphate kinase [Candidatus Peregrinibacteria bacterium]|nr:MAG: nucleoside monophosphate kinase [Candidatus Peregrinibacteria bacterium]